MLLATCYLQGLLVVLLFLGICNLYFTGNVPKLIRVARSHSVSPKVIIARILSLRLELRLRKFRQSLHLDDGTVLPHTAWLATLHCGLFILLRKTWKKTNASASAPAAMLPIIVGSTADIEIEGVFPRTK